MTTEDLLTVVALREKANFNADELFPGSQANQDDPNEGSQDLGEDEPNLRDAEPEEREGNPVENTLTMGLLRFEDATISHNVKKQSLASVQTFSMQLVAINIQ